MDYPLIDRQVLSALRLVHGGFNVVVMTLFFYHGRLGIAIRRARRAHAPLPLPAIKRHRKGVPLLAGLGVVGFFIGSSLVLLDTGNLLEYPFHFLAGALIVLCLISTFILSRRIKGPDSPYRMPHFALGVAILCLYVVESVLGVGVLF